MTYADFIAACRAKPLPERGEWHHVIPRSQEGSDDPENLVFLSYRDHIEAHWIYANETGRCWQAVTMMLRKGRCTLSRMQEEERLSLFCVHAEMRRRALSELHRRSVSAETRLKMSISHSGQKRTVAACEAARRTGLKNADPRTFVWRLPNGSEFIGRAVDVKNLVPGSTSTNLRRLINNPNGSSKGVRWLAYDHDRLAC